MLAARVTSAQSLLSDEKDNLAKGLGALQQSEAKSAVLKEQRDALLAETRALASAGPVTSVVEGPAVGGLARSDSLPSALPPAVPRPASPLATTAATDAFGDLDVPAANAFGDLDVPANAFGDLDVPANAFGDVDVAAGDDPFGGLAEEAQGTSDAQAEYVPFTDDFDASPDTFAAPPLPPATNPSTTASFSQPSHSEAADPFEDDPFSAAGSSGGTSAGGAAFGEEATSPLPSGDDGKGFGEFGGFSDDFAAPANASAATATTNPSSSGFDAFDAFGASPSTTAANANPSSQSDAFDAFAVPSTAAANPSDAFGFDAAALAIGGDGFDAFAGTTAGSGDVGSGWDFPEPSQSDFDAFGGTNASAAGAGAGDSMGFGGERFSESTPFGDDVPDPFS
eukprot:gene37069-44991_t